MVFITLERSILILLDLSEAFDTVDHVILIDCLEHKVNIRHVVLCWLSFYVAHRIFYFTVSVLSASLPDITCGVPQGSVLGLAFLYINIYVVHCRQQVRERTNQTRPWGWHSLCSLMTTVDCISKGDEQEHRGVITT